MDNRFKHIESELNFEFNPDFMNEAFNMMDNYDLDQAFIKASATEKANYSKTHWQEFLAAEPILSQDSSFTEAAADIQMPYHPSYWKEAEHILINEGLHFEYQSAYWKEAEQMLEKADRKAFFYRWTAIASSLLILGFVGQYFMSSPLKIDSASSPFVEALPKGKAVTSRTGRLFNINSPASTTTLISLSNLSNGNTPLTTPTQTSPEGPMPISNRNLAANNLANPSLINQVIPSANTTVGRINTTIVRPINGPYPVLIPHAVNNAPISTEKRIVSPDTYQPKHFFALAVYAKTGLGNSVNSNLNVSNRNALGLDFLFRPKQLRAISIKWSNGFVHESLKGFEIRENFSRYDISGKVDHTWYRYTYQALVRLNSTLVLGLDIGRKNKLNLGFGYERYMTTKLKLDEYFGESIQGQPLQWGVNDVFNPNDFNIRLGFEHQLSPMLALTLESKFGLQSKVNQAFVEHINNNRDIAALIGISYKLFRH